MGAGELMSLAGQFGPLGLFVGYLIWDKTQERKLAKERIETDLELARSMTLLAARIDGMKA